MNIGKTLAMLRKKRGLTQDQIADFLDIKRARYNSWENDIAKPGIEMLNRLADFYGVNTDFILGRNTNIDAAIDDENVLALARDIQQLDDNNQDLLKGIIQQMRKKGKEALDE